MLEKDIERCKKLTEPQNANWIGISNQKAIGHLISHYKNMKFNYENLIHDISLIAESLDMQEDSTIEEIVIRISEEMYNQQQINEEHQKINGELRKAINIVEKEKGEWIEECQQKDKRIQELEEYIAIAPNLDEMTATKYIAIQEEAYIRGKAEEQQKAEQIIRENYIPKQAVIDKIDELKLSGGSNGTDNVENLVRELTIEILQELLGG